MNGLMNFDFNNNSVRVITTENDILFIASDVAKVLGYIRPNDAVTSHCKKANSLINIVTVKYRDQQNQQLIGLDQKTKLIPESDVYRLVMRSKLESAEKFQDWVMEDVLPSIRKTGKYSIEQSPPSLPTTYLDALKALVVSEEQKLLLENKVKDDAPKVEFAETVYVTDDLITVSDLAKLLGTGQHRMFKQLRNDGYLGHSRNGYNIPYQIYMDDKQPYFKIKEFFVYDYSTNKQKLHKQPMITGKGQLYFQKKYNGVKI